MCFKTIKLLKCAAFHGCTFFSVDSSGIRIHNSLTTKLRRFVLIRTPRSSFFSGLPVFCKKNKTAKNIKITYVPTDTHFEGYTIHLNNIKHITLYVYFKYCQKIAQRKYQGSKFIFGFGSTCATKCKFLGALPKFQVQS